MRSLGLGVSVLAIVFTLVGIASADEKPNPREKPETAIVEGIRLLEGKEYVAFLKAFVPPAELKTMTNKETLEELAKKFGDKKAARLLKVLKMAKEVKPTMDANGTKATYDLKEAINGKKTITLIKIEKCWYVQN